MLDGADGGSICCVPLCVLGMMLMVSPAGIHTALFLDLISVAHFCHVELKQKEGRGGCGVGTSSLSEQHRPWGFVLYRNKPEV